MDVVPNQAHFTHYPTNHVLGILADEATVDRLCRALRGLGLSNERVKVFYGAQGKHNFSGQRGWLERTVQQLTGTSQDKLGYTGALDGGRYVVAADLHGQLDAREQVEQAFRAADGHDIKFLGTLVVDNLN